MACMEHQCSACNCEWFSNDMDGPCPACGSLDFHSTFDEDGRDHDDDRDEDFDEREDGEW